MIYKFRSAAAGDVVMLGAHGDQLLRLLGREPAPKGIFEVAALPALAQALERAVALEPRAGASDGGDDQERPPAVGLRQRLWPMIDMMRRCHAAGKPIVWGV